MTEPEYTYVRGQGWIVQSNTIILTLGCGNVVRVDVGRIPEHGESFACHDTEHEQQDWLSHIKAKPHNFELQYFRARVEGRETQRGLGTVLYDNLSLYFKPR